MSHIPAAAMPHAKAHEPAPEPKRAALPWAALAMGGALAIGGAFTAAFLLRGRRRPAPVRRTSAKRTATKRDASTSTRATPKRSTRRKKTAVSAAD